MRFDKYIRERLEDYESPLPGMGFEDLVSDTSIRGDSLVKKESQMNVYPLIPLVVVACLVVIFYNWSVIYETHEELLSLYEPSRYSDNAVVITEIRDIARATNQFVRLNDVQSGSSSLIVKDTMTVVAEYEKERKRQTTGATAIDTISQMEMDTTHPLEKIHLGEVSLPAGTRRFTDGKIFGIGSSSLVAACFLLQEMTDDRRSGGESLPIDSADPNPSPQHYLPFKVGMSVGIPLSQRWRLTSGLTYSRYSSKVYSPTPAKQRVHFLGIPLRIDGRIVVGNQCEIYAGIGIEEAFCVSATKTGDRIYHDDFVLSFQGAVGAQWFLSEHVAVYAEPVLSWTPFGQSFSPENALTEHPVSFLISSGFRYCFGL